MSYIFDATQPISPERQKIAKVMLDRKQMEMMTPGAMPTTLGGGLTALGQGLANGLEMRSLHNQANAPVDPWAGLRQVGPTAPTRMAGQPMTGIGAAFRNFFGGFGG